MMFLTEIFSQFSNCAGRKFCPERGWVLIPTAFKNISSENIYPETNRNTKPDVLTREGYEEQDNA